MGNTKFSYKQVKKEFENRGYELVSTEYVNTSEKLDYICNKHRNKGIQQIAFTKFHNCNHGCFWCGRERTEEAHRIEFNRTEDKELCELHNFKYIDTIRENKKIKIKFICNNHIELGVQKMTKYNMKRNINGCQYCAGRNLPEWYILEKLSKVNPDVYLLEPFKNLTSKISYLCKKHNFKTTNTVQNLLRGQGCYYCGIEKQSKNSYLSLEEYQNRVYNVSNHIKVIEYYGMEKNAKFQCEKCGYVWESCARTAVSHGKQCPNCKKYSVGEEEISKILDRWGIEYKQQYKFNDCYDKKPLPFDFYLTDFGVCLEYDGLHHYEQRPGWTDLKQIQLHDKIKNNFCHKNQIPLVRVPYWEHSELEYYLFDELVKLGVIIENNDTD